jgi:type III pantothenate kinase
MKKMLKLCIDAGNTQIKCAFFRGDELLKREVFKKIVDFENSSFLTENRENLHACLISNVGNLAIFEELKDKLRHVKFWNLNREMFHRLPNQYQSFETLGLDRLVNAVAATRLYPQIPVLVLDLGSCLTLTFVNSHGVLLGGSISPGLEMRAKAMNAFTAALPLVDPYKMQDDKIIGTSTLESVSKGAFLGYQGEIEFWLTRYSEQFSNIKFVFTGGDAVLFARLTKKEIFAAPNFTLTGLNFILNDLLSKDF